MSKTLLLKRGINDGGGDTFWTETVSSDELVSIDQSLVGPLTNQLLTFSFTKTKLKAIFIVADQNCTICTNNASGSSPQETLTLVAGQPAYLWTTSSGWVNPFGGDVTALYLTVGSVTVHLQIWALVANH